MTKRFGLLAYYLLLAAGPLYADDAEDAAVKAVEKLGGKVTRDYKDSAHPVVRVSFSGTQLTDAGLKELAVLKELETLGLRDTPVTGAGLKHLAELSGLKELDLDTTKVTDVGLKELPVLKGMQTLYLGGTQVTDTGMREL